MARLHHHRNPLWLQHLGKRQRNLLRQPLLHLEPAGKHFGNARQLRQADDAAVGNVTNVHLMPTVQSVNVFLSI